MKSLLQAINEEKESQFSLTELDQKIILGMIEYFYDNSQAILIFFCAKDPKFNH